ncbi:MAG: glycosyltransferase [Planctomycetaceae bacterium]|jgi:glycosyltransferase involved in cell wall biosynthesis|nr:glycosyltransferase [Planctomycetaceae bacterium]
MNIAHITASPSFGGPERQMLELARTLQAAQDAKFFVASFPEGGNAEPFLAEAEKGGFPAYRFQNDMPHLFAAFQEMIRYLRENRIDVLLAHGHKARLLGWLAARRLRIPIIGVSRGWTGENKKIRFFERIDKWIHRLMNHIVCVSQGQAEKVLRYGTPESRITVIHNSVRTDRFGTSLPGIAPMPEYRQKLEAIFEQKPHFLLGAAGRLSPEKGFDILIRAVAAIQSVAAINDRQASDGQHCGLVIFGEGFLHASLQEQIDRLNVTKNIKLAGFTDELDRFMPYFDVFVQSSHTEGLPNVLLEAMAARTAVVATEVGGTNEVVDGGHTGLLVPANNANALSAALEKVLKDDTLRKQFGENGRQRVEKHFTFEAQSEAYWKLIERFAKKPVS